MVESSDWLYVVDHHDGGRIVVRDPHDARVIYDGPEDQFGNDGTDIYYTNRLPPAYQYLSDPARQLVFFRAKIAEGKRKAAVILDAMRKTSTLTMSGRTKLIRELNVDSPTIFAIIDTIAKMTASERGRFVASMRYGSDPKQRAKVAVFAEWQKVEAKDGFARRGSVKAFAVRMVEQFPSLKSRNTITEWAQQWRRGENLPSADR